MTTSYVYAPLDDSTSIRLLRVDADAKCEVSQWKASEAPPYIAISYLWYRGDPTPSYPITIAGENGELFSKNVHDNLGHLLANLAINVKDGDTNYYWNDCLCLDQANHGETSEQVARMGAIYSAAAEVMIWLGHEPKISKALRIIEGTGDRSSENAIPEMLKGWLADRWFTSHREREVENAYVYLLSQDYWRRVWILQEVVLAQRVSVHASQTALDFDTFAAGAPPLRSVPQIVLEDHWTAWRVGEASLKEMIKLRTTPKSSSLPRLLFDHYERESTQKVDRIYGLLGLVASNDDEVNLAELVDVNMEKDAFEVFWDAMFECPTAESEYIDLLFTLRSMLGARGPSGTPHFSFAALQVYYAHSRTSSTHKEYAGCLLKAVRAAMDMTQLLNVQVGTLNWLNNLVGFAGRRDLPVTKSQAAALMGMKLLQDDIERNPAGPMANLTFEEEMPGYKCARHHPLGPQGQKLTPEGFYATYGLIWVRLKIPELRCSGGCMPGCDDSVIAFTLDAAKFQIVLYTRPEETSEGRPTGKLANWDKGSYEDQPTFAMRICMG